MSVEPTPNPEPRIDALDFYVGDDPHDRFPWTWQAYTADLQRTDGVLLGSICTPNGKRPDGTMHTAWMVAGDIWEPTGVIICNAVNRVAHERFGTPLPSSPYADEWRKERRAVES